VSVDVSTEIVIERPIERVADYSTNPDNAPKWYENIEAVEWKTAKPLKAGSRVSFVANFLGRTLVYTYEVVEFVPRELLVMRTAGGPFPMETTYVWRATSDGKTHMTLRNQGFPTGFSRAAVPLVALAMRWANRKDLRRLKEIMEARR
jgi:uncharacterized membrane protein